MRVLIISLSFLSSIALGGCKKEPPSTPKVTPEATQPEATQPKAFSAPTASAIKVLSSGTEPRQELRSSIKPGLKQKLKITVDNEIEAVVAILAMKQQVRSVIFELAVQRKEDGPGDTRVFAFTIEKTSVDHPEGLSPTVRESRESDVAAMLGMEGSYLVDSFGSVRTVQLAVPSDASRELWGIVADLDWALRQLGVPFPKEATGAGAQWTVEQGVEQDGVHANEVSTLEITKLGKLVTVKKEVQQSAAPQTFRNPGSSVDSELADLSGEGAGEITWDPTQPLPRSAKVTSTVTKNISYPSEGKTVKATMVTRRTLSVGPD